MNKFIIAMIALAVILLILMSVGFAATEYLKRHPDTFQVQPKK
ncbi:hypothetical protein [Neisseria yangbaofengii]|nr:hypothetical protein [Neisseria yangbaofengii]